MQERQRSTKRQEEKARKDPMKSKRPDLPLGIKGTGGRVQTGGSTLHSWMAKQISVKNKDDHIDPRERILRHAEEAEKDPYWIGKLIFCFATEVSVYYLLLIHIIGCFIVALLAE